MKNHEVVQNNDDKHLNNYCRDELTIANKYEEHHRELLSYSKKVASTWDNHLGRITTAKYRTELTDENISPVQSISYRAGPPERKAAASKIDGMLQEEVIKQATTRWASSIVFAPKNGSLEFYVDYRKPNASTICKSYSPPQ